MKKTDFMHEWCLITPGLKLEEINESILRGICIEIEDINSSSEEIFLIYFPAKELPTDIEVPLNLISDVHSINNHFL